mgnify:CR=1 FL=1
MTQDTQKAKGSLRTDQDELMFGQGFSFSGYERDPLFLNLGNRKFVDISGCSGIDSVSDGRAGVFADFDNDGDLDLFVGNGNTGSTGYLMRSQLFLGNGDGTFVDASSRLGGSGNKPTLANGSMACDFDGDADLDLFVSVYGVSNGGAQNALWRNDGTGTFTDEAVSAGVASLPGGNYWRQDTDYGRLAEPGKSPGKYVGGNGFGVDCPDIDNDGRIDILQADISHSTTIPPGYRGMSQAEIDALNYTRRWSDPSQLLRNLGAGEPLAFANVLVLGTTLGAISQSDGKFVIKAVPSGSHEIQASFMGYEVGRQPVTVPPDPRVASMTRSPGRESWKFLRASFSM